VCFSLWYLYYHPVDSHHQHRPTADSSHLIPVAHRLHISIMKMCKSQHLRMTLWMSKHAVEHKLINYSCFDGRICIIRYSKTHFRKTNCTCGVTKGPGKDVSGIRTCHNVATKTLWMVQNMAKILKGTVVKYSKTRSRNNNCTLVVTEGARQSYKLHRNMLYCGTKKLYGVMESKLQF
jgi:hypothetical protein